MGITFWVTQLSFDSDSKSKAWAYPQLLTKADQVTRVVIKGSGVTAIAKSGSRHDGRLPDTGTDLLRFPS
jgi:hypothetical protein